MTAFSSGMFFPFLSFSWIISCSRQNLLIKILLSDGIAKYPIIETASYDRKLFFLLIGIPLHPQKAAFHFRTQKLRKYFCAHIDNPADPDIIVASYLFM